MTDFEKGISKARSLVRSAELRRDRSGYHENLGYEDQHILENYLDSLKLTYQEHCQIITDFYKGCGAI